MIWPASSKSELVIVPMGLSEVMSLDWIDGENGARQSIGGKVGSPESQTPPIPKPDASAVP